MASNYPLHLGHEERDFASRWASSLLIAALILLAVLMFVAAAWPDARESESAWKRHVAVSCRSSECLSPAQILTPERAGWIKRDLGNRVLVVDIGTPGEPQRKAHRVPIDAYVPFMESGSDAGPSGVADSPGLAFRTDFCRNLDEALTAAHLRHGEQVILLSPSMERTMLAALLLQEHGYSNIFVMNS
jgi:hypothetical protein